MLTVLITYAWINVIYFTELRLFFHKLPFIINTLLLNLRVTLYIGCLKMFAEASQPFIHAFIAARRRPKNGVLGLHVSGGHKDGSRGVLNRGSRESEEEKIQGADFSW
jgi:hypothetical protein